MVQFISQEVYRKHHNFIEVTIDSHYAVASFSKIYGPVMPEKGIAHHTVTCDLLRGLDERRDACLGLIVESARWK
jgi:hypothetical protein